MKKNVVLLMVTIMTLLVLSACGNSSSDNKGNSGTKTNSSTANNGQDNGVKNEDNATKPQQEVKKIRVGTGNNFPKVFYVDDNGELTGFDIELLKAIDERLPQYEFDLQVSDLTNLLLGLETNKIDMIAHNLEKNPEREEKYLFNTTPYTYRKNKIVVAKDNNDPIETLDDLKGKKAIVIPNSATATLLDQYNKEHDNAIKMVYQNGTANDLVAQIASGRVDFMISPDFTLPILDPEGSLKTVGKTINKTEILYAFRKNDPEEAKLAEAIDGVIQELKKDGTLSKLSIKWIGFDTTTEE